MRKLLTALCVLTIVGLLNFRAHAEDVTPTCGGSADDTAVMNAFNYAKSVGGKLTLPQNRVCNMASQAFFDLNGALNGFTMDGFGADSSRLTSTSTANPAVKFYTSGGSFPGVQANTTNFIRQNFRIHCYNNGGRVCVQDGENNYTDSGSGWQTHNLFVTSDGTGANSVNFKINYQVHPYYDISTATAGAGAAGNGSCIQMTWLRMGTLFATAGGCTTAIHTIGTHNEGNLLLDLDCEVVKNCWVIDGSNQNNNTAMGGYWNYTSNGIVQNATSTTSVIAYNPFIESPGAGSFISGSNSAGAWIDNGIGSSTSPGGSSNQVQVNSSGSFGGLTNTQLTAKINAFTSSLLGAAPASGGGTSTYLRADGSWAVPPGTGGGGTTTWPAMSAYGSTQSLSSGSFQIAQYATEVYDNNSAYNNGTYIFTAPATGLYEVEAAARIPMANGSNAAIKIYKNGSAYNADRNWSVTANLGQMTIHDEMSLTSGDTISIYIFQDTGSSKTVLLENFTIHQFSN